MNYSEGQVFFYFSAKLSFSLNQTNQPLSHLKPAGLLLPNGNFSTLVLLFGLMSIFYAKVTFAGDYWEDHAYLCEAPNGYRFPAKSDGGECADGDSTLFNALLCNSGDKRGCDAVRNSQTGDGQFWRSPRRAQTNNIGKGDSDSKDLPFSDDQNLGVLLYVISTGDTPAFQRWLDWLERNRPCSRPNPFTQDCTGYAWLYVKGLPRYCGHANCTLQPIYRDMLKEVADYFNLSAQSGIDHYYSIASTLTLGFSDLILKYGFDYLDLPTTSKLYLNSRFDESGFPLHLDAVRALILHKIGNPDLALNHTIKELISREPKNPFYEYVSEGATVSVAELVIQYCPSPIHPVDDMNYRVDYTWEQANSSQWSKPFKHDGNERSMLWDCIMMRNLSPAYYPKYDSAVPNVINYLLLSDEP